MARPLRFVFTLTFVGFVVACGGSVDTSNSSGGSSSQEGSANKSSGDGSNAFPSIGSGACCPPDPRPGCCMNYGGWIEDATCGQHYSCDGMPWPNDPSWRIEKDDHGCDRWVSKPYDAMGCGSVRLDAGADADGG